MASLLFSSAEGGALNGGSSALIHELRDPNSTSTDRDEPRSSSPKPSSSDTSVIPPQYAAPASSSPPQNSASGAIPKSYSFGDGAASARGSGGESDGLFGKRPRCVLGREHDSDMV